MEYVNDFSQTVDFSHSRGYPIIDVFDIVLSGCGGIKLHFDFLLGTPSVLILIETESVFNSARRAQFAKEMSTIFVLTHGYASKNTTGFVCLLKNKLPGLKIFTFGDCGPHGVSIMARNASSKFSNNMPNRHRFSAQWIGIFPSQIQHDENETFQYFSDDDISKFPGLLDHVWTTPRRREEILLMQQSGKKYQSEYVLSKIGGFKTFILNF